MLISSDIVKYGIPVPFAFVPVNPTKAPGACSYQPVVESKPLDSFLYANSEKCQSLLRNFNNAVANKVASSASFYKNALDSKCLN